ncbi:MAG: PepSY domain-containing protein [Paeniclostridium sordellii]|uniref:PepSY domain-containing protein n=1 Tax=Paeniclostridium hominis TaxID=2764329 RepID=A0ABR7K396_9FIRM|nr:MULTISPECIES: PepSY domain-containing protein [Paeniclostridium]MBC6003583.1 PepSY domain-containing protein [Paeniclostridium hominis]MDU2592582.1 PepSY domain-containing protein [Paeniclostridium sordellii]
MKREDIKNKLETYKNEGFEKSKEMIKEKKGKIKKFAILTLTGSIVLAGIGAGTAFAFVKSNTKYSQEKLKEIALSKIPGEVVGVKKDIDEDSMSLTYEFKIKDKNNMLNEIELDSKTGAIIDIENHNDHKDYDDNDHKKYNSNDKNYSYNDLKANIKFSQEDAKKIALEKVSGEVLKVKEEIDEDNNSLVYEFKIKTKDNTIKEVEVDSKMGNIVDIDNHDDDFNLENQNNKVDSNKDLKK